jgi:hypothetical protein
MCEPDPIGNQSIRCAGPVCGFGADSMPHCTDVAVRLGPKVPRIRQSRQFTSGVGEIPVSLECSAGSPE